MAPPTREAVGETLGEREGEREKRADALEEREARGEGEALTLALRVRVAAAVRVTACGVSLLAGLVGDTCPHQHGGPGWGCK